MVDTFRWQQQTDDTGTETARTRSAQFGDGYKQVVPDGINNLVQSWPLTFSGPRDMIFQIRDFLRAHKGASSFYWTPPGDVQGLYRADTWTVQPRGGNAYTLTVILNQAFTP
ncbi:phage tail protein [Dyella caseinilytica]|uniref:Phage tail protein n=1 Tax=Dyella caseinilytica TaxID=1849581 RepID=A0ABX7GPQ7_9GAMM|nr:phage tail protein [Dyella caseinilytica]QRN52388.1 phage tail protein [Dyella caseinilytica]GGA05548.1 hypothetical protein GCM10011408_28100 [Dyella caseinilytica]